MCQGWRHHGTALRWWLVAKRLGLGVSALIILSRLALFAALDQYEGKPVALIEFDPPKQPLTVKTLQAMIPLKVGQPLHAVDIRAAIQRLYATGEYGDIAVDASALESGDVRIRFITTLNYFVGYVGVEGVPEPPSEGQLATATKLQLGAEFNDIDINQAVESLTDVLRRNGFYKTNIVPNVERDPSTSQIKIRFLVAPGRRARFNGVSVTGDTQRSTRSVIFSTGWKPLHGMLPWRAVADSRVQSGIEGVRGWYQRNNRLLAHVTLTKIDYQAEKNRVTPALDIQAGPKVRVKLEGAKVSGGQLRSLLPIFEERTVDRDLLVEGRKNLTTYFQSKGYFEAETDFSTDPQPNGDELIKYEADLGPRHKLVHLEIGGNAYFSTSTLRERMYVTPATRLRYRWGRYSHEYLEKDLNAIRDLYRSNGFREVEVNSREVDDYQGSNNVAVFITVKEGAQSFVSKLEIEGVTASDLDYLRSILHSTEGQPYSEYSIGTDRDSILEYFYNNGYPKAKFEFTAVPSADLNHIALRFQIDTGPPEFVRGVLINGLNRTDEDLVSRRISLTQGDPLSQSRIAESQRRLYDLGIFAKVNTAQQNPEGDEASKYVLYSLEEARRYSLNVGFGAEIARIGGGTTTLDSPAGTTGFSPRVSIGVNRLNLFGLGHTIGLQTRVSTLQQRALVTYAIPQFEGNAKLNLQFSGLFDISKDVRTFSARREEGSVQLGRKLTKANSIQFRYAFRKVNIIGTPLVTPELIPILSQPVRVGLLGLSFAQDRRDDPADAHHGVYNTVDVSLANKGLGSQTGFGRVIARNATYYRVTKTVTLARSTYFGVIQRYGGLTDIPLAERFFSGGSSSQRAFPDNQAGPRDLETGFPIGGNALFMNSVEMRFPLVGDNIGGVLFNDLGNVYSSIGNISLRWGQRNLSDFDYAVQSFGFGIRYRTPIGPVRVDLSVSPNSPHFFGFQGTYNELIFGGGKQVVQRINVFQFHFSLGQAF
jgi:outer membrane protein insertion porin family